MNDQNHGDKEEPTFSVRLLIKHPSWDPSDLTRDLGLTPHITHKVGEARQTPTRSLPPGMHLESAWSHMIEVTMTGPP